MRTKTIQIWGIKSEKSHAEYMRDFHRFQVFIDYYSFSSFETIGSSKFLIVFLLRAILFGWRWIETYANSDTFVISQIRTRHFEESVTIHTKTERRRESDNKT